MVEGYQNMIVNLARRYGRNCHHLDVLAVVQLMRTSGLRQVFKAAVTAPDGTHHRWWEMECSAGDAEREFV